MNTLTKRRQAFYKYLREVNMHGIHFPEDELRQALSAASVLLAKSPRMPVKEFDFYLGQRKFIRDVLAKHGIKAPTRRK